jgi:hypothetical protein
MPGLHKYRDRDACYVLTAIRGAVDIFQLTAEGEKKLTSSGIACGQQLRIPMKADSCSNSYRTGIPIDVGQLSERSDALG